MDAINRVRAVADAVDANKRGEDDDSSEDPEFGPLESWMAMIIIMCSVLIVMATMGLCKWRSMLTYWDQEGSILVREYLQKMSVYNGLLLAIQYLVYKYVFNYKSDDNDSEACLKLGEHKLIVFLIVFGSLVTGLIRFLAVGFANSESYSFGGHAFTNQNAQQGFSAHTNHIYRNMIGPYVKMMLLVLVLIIVFLCAPIPSDVTDPVLDLDFCLNSWPITGEGYQRWRLLPIGLLLLLPIITIVIIEHVAHVKRHGFFTKTPGYISILNAPFIMVALTTTWSMWFGILFVVWWTFGIGAGEYFSMLTLLYITCDSLVLLFVAVVVGRRNKPLC